MPPGLFYAPKIGIHSHHYAIYYQHFLIQFCNKKNACTTQSTSLGRYNPVGFTQLSNPFPKTLQ